MENPIARIGQTNFRNQNMSFGIKQNDRLSHMLALGKTGSGKSTILAQMMRSDLEHGTGFALLDAHGDLAGQVLQCVPDSRLSDVVYIDPATPRFSPSINLMAGRRDYLAISQFLASFQHLWPEFWGPRTEYLLRNTLLLLAETLPGASLGDVPRVLTDFDFRTRLANGLRTGDLRQFWNLEFAQYSKHFRNEAIAPILNKTGAVLFNPTLRSILCRRRNDIDFRDIIDSGKVLIVNLAKGTVGEDGSALLGSLILTRLVAAGLSRSEQPVEARRFFGIYADEAQAFVTDSTLSLFSELRKYGVGATWSAQYLSGFSESVRDAILGNVGTLITFAASGQDAEILARELAPVARPQDLVSLASYHFFIKLRIDGVTSRPFSGVTLPMQIVSSEPVLSKIRAYGKENEPESLRQNSPALGVFGDGQTLF
jgi:hypothetical protein